MQNNVIRKASNRWTKGLIMDFSPENTRNEVLTHALNATLLTFNGNELSLQNDMGNGRVETAYLPEGYIPVGTCEYGGIIYIVSYNPLEDKSLIGCFPSPERNISNDELGKPDALISKSYFLETDKNSGEITGNILHNTLYVLLKNDKLNPGDKFIVCAEKSIYNEKLTDLWVDKDDKYYPDDSKNPKNFELVSNPIIALNVVSIEDSGKIVYLNNDIRQYEEHNNYNLDGIDYLDTYKYHILGKMLPGANQLAKEDLDSYRNILSSGYSVFKSKTSGKLAILAELIMIDSYSVTHEVRPKLYNGDIVEGSFDVIIHTEITPEITQENYNIVPKLQYFYLQNSQGYLLTWNYALAKTENRTLFVVDDNKVTNEYNSNFSQTLMNTIYTAIDSDVDAIINPKGENETSPTLGSLGQFNFPKPYTYHGRMIPYEGDLAESAVNSIYTKFTEGKYHRIDYSQISSNLPYYTKDVQAKFYYYNTEGQIHIKHENGELNELFTYYIRKDAHEFYDAKRDEAYIGEDLYELLSHALSATEDQIEDTSIEKFQYQEIHTYRLATLDDIDEGEKLYYKGEDGLSYIEVTGSVVSGEEYYVLEIEENLVSIGFVVDYETVLGEVYYYPEEKVFEPASATSREKYYDFDTYPYESEAPYGCPITLYRREENWEYIAVTYEEAEKYLKENKELFYSTDYILIKEIDKYREPNQLFIVVPMDTFISLEQFLPSETYNYIEGKDKPSGDYPKDDPISLYTLADFIPENIDPEADKEENANKLKYNPITLASIKLPKVVYDNGLDLPFKYDYTIVPCMNYGRLNHLAVSNTVDFSKLHAFNQSDFSTWKYYISENQLKLTFGADVYDTYETNKVDGLVLEFYDCWGFAGSLEIVDKKAYSGIFTKIIPLNSLRALSRKKILANDYSEIYKHNINIKEITNEEGNLEYFYNNTKLGQPGQDSGWANLSEDDNDCGTLYSNVIYGVKAYLRRTTASGKEFIHKRNFFLYTLPIYNDYYYTTDNFNTLEEPLLDLMLTYKIKDSSTRTAYTQEGEENIIKNGYTPKDKAKIDDYLAGFSSESSIDIIRYYKYKGTSDLYLEIGLKKDYEALNLSYDPEINKLFTCNLKLVNDKSEDETFSVNSGVEGLSGVSQVLNYNNGEITIQKEGEPINSLSFDSGSTTEITSGEFYNANFIHNEGNFPIKINYEFIVGYTANISEIRSTQVQATTICALFHQNPNGEYNYEDFGVYEQTSTESDGTSKTELLSSVMFYNEGTAETEIFGTCRQISTTGNILELCGDFNPVETEATEIKILGKLNTGEPLKQLINSIGKLTFCQPHAHGVSDVNGVNIHGGEYNSYYGIPPEKMYVDLKTKADRTFGIMPTDLIYLKPKYNLSLNTKNSIKYCSEFISTLDYNTITGSVAWWGDRGDDDWGYVDDITMREFTGFTGSEIATFNLKMIETMKSVYAYNPDYDSLTVNVGNISLQNYNPYFTSNILSYNANLNFSELTLNDYIYIGPIKFSDYLKHLKEFSIASDGSFIEVYNNNMFLPQVQLIPGYDYCGSNDNYYLVSSLTYNTPVPKDLESELEFSASDNIVIKHTDGSNTFMKGVPNKKVLYGYNEKFDKMIQLDVSNYTIDSNGALTLKDIGLQVTKSMSLEINDEIGSILYEHGTYTYEYPFEDLDGNIDNIKIQTGLSIYNSKGYSYYLAHGKDANATTDSVYGLICGSEISASNGPNLGSIHISPNIYIISSNKDVKYTVTVDSIELAYSGVILNDEVSLYGRSSDITLSNQSYQALADLVSSEYRQVTLIDKGNNSVTNSNYTYGVNYSTAFLAGIGGSYGTDRVTLKNGYYLSEDVLHDINLKSNTAPLIYYYYINLYSNSISYDGYFLNLLFNLRIKSISFTITQSSSLESSMDLFIKTNRTTKYTNKVNHKYVILDEYKQARLRGSSITINDLLYEPSTDGHRLFIRNNLCTYDPDLRGKLYYRLNDAQETSSNPRPSDALEWMYGHSFELGTNKYLNSLFLYTGPCYTLSNLYLDD